MSPWTHYILSLTTGEVFSKHHSAFHAHRRFGTEFLSRKEYDVFEAGSVKELARIQTRIQVAHREGTCI